MTIQLEDRIKDAVKEVVNNLAFMVDGDIEKATDIAINGEDSEVELDDPEDPCITNYVGYLHGMAFVLDTSVEAMVKEAMK